MDLREIVFALLAFDALAAREGIERARSIGLDWSRLPSPSGLSPDELALAASLVERMAGRAGMLAPAWAREAAPASRATFLAPPDFLAAA